MSVCIGAPSSLQGPATHFMESDKDGWLSRFHQGDRDTLEACYRDHYSSVERVVGGVLRGADRETVIHEVFYRLLTRPELRKSYSGGSLSAWLHTLARNHAIDHIRRAQRDVPLGEEHRASEPTAAAGLDEELDARRLIGQFRREVLPPGWAPVFEKRFLEQLDQREAARRIGISRTTLAYRELRIRAMLKRFLLSGATT